MLSANAFCCWHTNASVIMSLAWWGIALSINSIKKNFVHNTIHYIIIKRNGINCSAFLLYFNVYLGDINIGTDVQQTHLVHIWYRCLPHCVSCLWFKDIGRVRMTNLISFHYNQGIWCNHLYWSFLLLANQNTKLLL